MADHYGDAEKVIGHHHATHASSPPTKPPPTAFTKWCPAENGTKTFANAEAAIHLALSRLGQTQIPLLQYHIWDYTNDTYLHNLTHLTTLRSQGKIAHIGLTNTDAAHLKLLLDTGFPIATNQVSCSVLDRRILTGRLNELCRARGVGLLCYGTLLGGFLSEKWLGAPEPTSSSDELNWSLRKYLRFIHAAGGWSPFQAVLRALDAIAKKHGVSIAAVAMRWVLDIPSVKAVIVGARLTAQSREYAERNLLVFQFALDEADRRVIAEAQEGLRDVPGDCGDEYRRAPYLTAAGDLSHHVKEADEAREVREAIAKGKRVEYLTGSKWEPICVSLACTSISCLPVQHHLYHKLTHPSTQGYSRAVRTKTHIHISGTTANPPPSLLPSLTVIGGTSAESQAVWILDIIGGALKALGSSMQDLVRTRVLLPDATGDCEAVSRAHGWAMQTAGGGVLPANTLVQVGLYEEQFRVEMEAWAEVGSGEAGVVRVYRA